MKLYLDKLRQIRKNQKLTAEELANKMGIHRTTYCAWEYGKVIPNEAKVRMLARVLKVTTDQISDLEPDKPVSSVQYTKAIQDWLTIASSDKDKQEKEIAILLSGISHVSNKLKNCKLIVDALLSSLPSIFYVKDINLKYITVNDSFLQQLSLNKNYIVLNKKDSDFFSRRETIVNEEQDRQVIISGESIINEGFIPGSRKKKWGLISKIPIVDSEGRIEGVVGSFVDITDRKKAEQMREFLEVNLNLMSDAVLVRDAKDFNCMYLNKSVEKIYGYPKEKIKDNGWIYVWFSECVHPDDRKSEIEYMEKKSWPEIRTFRIIRSDGETRWIESYCHKIEYKEKSCFFFIDRDITSRKEHEFRKTIMENAMYRVNEVLWVINSKSKCILLSGNTKKLYGKSLDEVDNPLDYWRNHMLHSDYYEKNDEMMLDFKKASEEFNNKDVKDGYLINTPAPFIYKLRRPDSNEVYIESTYSYMFYNNEIYALALDREISHRQVESDLKLKEIENYITNNDDVLEPLRHKILSICRKNN